MIQRAPKFNPFALFPRFRPFEMRNGLQFEEVLHVFVIDKSLCLRVITLACADVAVEHSVGEAEIVFISLATESVRGSLLYKVDGQPSSLPTAITSATVRPPNGAKSPAASP